MAYDFHIKQGDTYPAFQTTITDAAGDAIDITDASVRFHLRRPGADTLIVDAAAEIVTAASGIVKYVWADGDTDETGVFDAEFEVTFDDDTVLTFPNSEHLSVMIFTQLG
jgi:hypothetical protein